MSAPTLAAPPRPATNARCGFCGRTCRGELRAKHDRVTASLARVERTPVGGRPGVPSIYTVYSWEDVDGGITW